MWNWLRNRTLFGLKFRRQHPVNQYILDFYCPELKLCIELDGRVHNEFAVAMHDAQRDNDLAKLGIVVVRIENPRTGRAEADILRDLHHPSP